MKLTIKMREELAFKLACKAIAPNDKPLAKRLKASNERFWAQHIKNVEQVFPMPRKQWAEMIQLGVVAGVADAVLSTESESGSQQGVGFVSLSHFTHSRTQEQFVLRIFKVGMEEVANYFKPSDYLRSLTFTAKASCSLPYLRKMRELPPESDLAREIPLARDELIKVLKAGLDFHAKATALLNSCKTKAQLEKVFPEAAALIPEPPKPKQEVAPLELAESVRNMLNKGVPPVTA